MTSAAIFGKLPAHGDFIARGFAPDVRDALDDWLSTSMADAREALGDAFEDAFDSAPPWRFAWEEAGGWVAGAIAPSVDGVGRRYPILAQVAVAGREQARDGAAHCEAAIYDAFGEGWNADRLQAAVGKAPALWEDDWPGHAGWWTMGSEDREAATLAGERPDLLIRAMLTLPARSSEDAHREGAE
ncbi:type VI secretion system-associated protein TagF [Sphingomonas gilva]|uniref:type VI secretion system-associated protein TagF n=1 Tax=Sphingomonas gilva TaxID=2305907 RepID=UPI0015F7CD5A|nr:type VI secretion system-associated protein TagF [Sphingomonas gilva]